MPYIKINKSNDKKIDKMLDELILELEKEEKEKYINIEKQNKKHIMETFWQTNTIQQIIGKGIRRNHTKN